MEDTRDNESPEMLQLRWENAERVAKKINNLMDKGFIVLNEEGTRILYPFTINSEGITLPYSEGGGGALYFLKDKDLDNGYYTPIEEYNEHFKGWKFIHPDNISDIWHYVKGTDDK